VEQEAIAFISEYDRHTRILSNILTSVYRPSKVARLARAGPSALDKGDSSSLVWLGLLCASREEEDVA